LDFTKQTYKGINRAIRDSGAKRELKSVLEAV